MLRTVLVLAAVTLAAANPARAGNSLPAAVDGQPLPTLAPMLERVTPAVVNVNSKTKVRERDPFADDPFFRHFFGLPNAPRERIQQSLGSGVVIDAAKGYVLTNNHVVQGADDISVTLADGRTVKAERVGTDPDTDVAVIRIPADKLTAIPLADSAKLRVGDFVVAVGNPFGIGQSVTSGIVSALGRSGLNGLGYQNFIQTDASINPGNSGGALVNLRGELVGINTAIYSPSGGNVGIGFAIPANLAGDVMRQLLAFGSVKRGSLGIDTQDIDADIAEQLGGLTPGHGAVVTRVRAGSPAEQAGLRAGDAITAVNGKPISGARDLANAEGLLPLGARARLDIVRDGKPSTLEVGVRASVQREAVGNDLDPRLAGATIRDVSDDIRRRGLTGVQVKSVADDSRAERNGLAPGDVIVGVNQRDLEDLKALETILAKRPRQLLLTVARGRQAFYLQMQ